MDGELAHVVGGDTVDDWAAALGEAMDLRPGRTEARRALAARHPWERHLDAWERLLGQTPSVRASGTKQRWVFVCLDPAETGLALVVRPVIEEVERRGHEVRVVAGDVATARHLRQGRAVDLSGDGWQVVDLARGVVDRVVLCTPATCQHLVDAIGEVAPDTPLVGIEADWAVGVASDPRLGRVSRIVHALPEDVFHAGCTGRAAPRPLPGRLLERTVASGPFETYAGNGAPRICVATQGMPPESWASVAAAVEAAELDGEHAWVGTNPPAEAGRFRVVPPEDLDAVAIAVHGCSVLVCGVALPIIATSLASPTHVIVIPPGHAVWNGPLLEDDLRARALGRSRAVQVVADLSQMDAAVRAAITGEPGPVGAGLLARAVDHLAAARPSDERPWAPAPLAP